jgi:hypothetical protein
MAFVTYVTGSVSCAQFCYCFIVLILHTTKSWRGSYFFWLFVTTMRGQRDDDVRLRRLFVGELCKRGVRGSTKSCEMVFLISPCPF